MIRALKHGIDLIKASLLLMGYALAVTLFVWAGMFIVSFIPVFGQGREGLYNIAELTVFWSGIICGILSLFIVVYYVGGELTFELKSPIEKEMWEDILRID